MKKFTILWLLLSLIVISGGIVMGCNTLVQPQNAQSNNPQALTSIGKISMDPLPAVPPTLIPNGIATEEIRFPEPTRTPRPNLGVQVQSVVEITSQHENLNIQKMYPASIDNKRLLMVGAYDGKKNQVILVNLKTNEIQLIPITDGKRIGIPKISGNHIVWLQPAPELGQYSSHLNVFDLSTLQKTLIRSGFAGNISFQDNIIVWEDREPDRSWGLYGYNLESKQLFTVVEETGIQMFPQVCSNEWVIYLNNPDEDLGKADLYAHNVINGTNKLIGEVVFFKDATQGRHHACDNTVVVWISTETEQANLQSWDNNTGTYHSYTGPVHKQHIYNLQTDMDTVITGMGRGLPSDVDLVGNFFISTTGYDIKRAVYFDALPADLPLQYKIGGGILLDYELIVWQSAPYNNPSQLLLAYINQN